MLMDMQCRCTHFLKNNFFIVGAFWEAATLLISRLDLPRYIHLRYFILVLDINEIYLKKKTDD